MGSEVDAVQKACFPLPKGPFLNIYTAEKGSPMPVQDGVLRVLLPHPAIVWLCTEAVVLVLILSPGLF